MKPAPTPVHVPVRLRWLRSVAFAVPLVALFLLLPVPGRAGSGQERTEAEPPAPTERPFLWRIDAEPPSYLFGTIHLPDERVLLQPEVLENVVASVDAVYPELALEPDLGERMQPHMYLPLEQSLDRILPEDLYQRLDRYLLKYKLRTGLFNRFKPWALLLQLSTLDYMRELATRTPIDGVLYATAKKAGKEVGGLETLEEQLAVFEDFSLAQQVELLEATLDELEAYAAKGQTAGHALVEVYLEGDLDVLVEEVLSVYDDEGETSKLAMDRLIWDRNERMGERIVKLLREREGTSFLFAVGAAHLPEERGLLALLAEAGFELRRLGPDDAEAVLEEHAVTAGN